MKPYLALPALLLFLWTIALAQDNTPTPLQQDAKVEKAGLGYVVFKQAKEAVWTAVVETMTSYNWRPQTMDSASGVVFLHSDGRWGSAWGSNNILVERFTTKKLSKWSTWQSIALEANIMVKALEPYRTEVRMTAKLAGCNGWQAAFNKYASCKWEPLETNGVLEQEVFERISSKVPELSSAELYPASKPDEKVLSAAHEQVISFEKVVAAFDLNAPADRIITELVNAKASLQTFSDSPESQVLPKFTIALKTSMQKFAIAVTGKPEERPPALKTAMDSFGEAKKCTVNYQKFVQEVEPSPGQRQTDLVPAPGQRSASPGAVQQAMSAIQQEPDHAMPDSEVLIRMLGLQVIEKNTEQGGAVITQVAPGSVAEAAGMRSGNVIESVDGKPIKNPLQLAKELVSRPAGSRVRIGYIFRSSAMGWLPTEAIVTLPQQGH